MSEQSCDPIAKYANYRKDIADAVSSGKGQGLFGPIFVDLYDTVLALRAQLATAQRASQQQDSDWLAVMKAIAVVVNALDSDNAWTHTDDGTLLEQFDPWQALREIGKPLATLQAATPIGFSVGDTERAIIEAMRDDWLTRYEPGDSEWADAQVIDAWLDGYRGTMYGDATNGGQDAR